MPDASPPLPTFLIIGAQKSATRWLRTNLGFHPEVFAASEEIAFFNYPRRVKRRGPSWYREQFRGWSGEPHVGEATPGYMIWRHHPEQVAATVQEIVPDVRLLAILRNPVDRAYSAMIHQIRRKRLPADANLLELVRETPPETEWFGLVAGGWYGASLAPYVERFGDQLKVLLHDDIKTDAAGLYQEALVHVGLTDGFVPEGLTEVRYSNRTSVAAKKQRQLSEEERVALWEYFADDVARLQDLLGRDLSAWDPTTVPSRRSRRSA